MIRKFLKILIITALCIHSVNADNLKSFVDDFVNRTDIAVNLPTTMNDNEIVVSPAYYSVREQDKLKDFFSTVITSNGYKIDFVDNIFIISTNDNNTTKGFQTSSVPTTQKQYVYDLKYLTQDDIQTALSSFGNVSIQYLKSYNKIVFSCEPKDKNKLLSFLQKIDIPIHSKNIKITVFNSNDSVAEDIGLQIDKLGAGIDYSVVNGVVTNNTQIDFKAYFSALRNNNKITISQSPTFLLSNGNKLSFKSVKNIPYLTQSSTVQNTGSSTTNSYSYKDVGLQIELIPHISKYSTIVDLNLKIEDLVDLNSDKPLTNRLEYQNTVTLTNVPVLLTGLKKTIKSNNVITIPLLSNLPFVGELFKYKVKNDEVSNMSILIEFISSKDNQ